MVPEARTTTTTEVRQPVEQEPLLGGARPTITPLSSQSAIERRLYQMPPAGRWALGLALAFLSGLGFLSSMSGAAFFAAPGISVVVMCAIGLVAGFVISSWWAAPALTLAVTAGGCVAGWIINQVYLPANWISLDPGGLRSEVQFFFVLLAGLPLILCLLAGTALGRRRGLALEQPSSAPTTTPHAPLPTPSQNGFAASVQQIPYSERWALGLALGFLSGLAVLFAPYANASTSSPLQTAMALIVMCALALAAGFVLSSWWAVPALIIVASVGGLMASWGLTRETPGGTGGEMGALAWFAMVGLGPLIVFLLAGVGIGKQRGIVLAQPRVFKSEDATMRPWIPAIALVIATGYAAGMTGVAYTGRPYILVGVLNAFVLAATCLMAGWLLRSWWGLVAATVVYAGVAALMAYRFGNGGVGLIPVLTAGFVFYIILPAVVMSAIGAAIGMFGDQRSRRRQRRVA